MKNRVNYICDYCGKEYSIYFRKLTKLHFCSRECRDKAGRELHLFTRKGSRQDKQGYIVIYSPDHPYRNSTNYVPEHRLVVEKSIGRYLTRSEIVYHRNGIKSDNRLENLEVVTRAVHYGEVECPHCHSKFLIK